MDYTRKVLAGRCKKGNLPKKRIPSKPDAAIVMVVIIEQPIMMKRQKSGNGVRILLFNMRFQEGKESKLVTSNEIPDIGYLIV